jgi:ectoine hydroxylase-related dioxygenase (phytanoyl-CoA dioxygenase family)
MLGRAKVDYSRMLMQLDSDSGKYEDAGAMSKGHKGATLNYRKIQDLEWDPLFLAYVQAPLCRDIVGRVHGAAARVACFRAMFMNKPAGKGTVLPWHQDRWNNLDRDPQVTIWTALDPATRANGCVQVIPGTHRALLNPAHPSGFLTPEQAAQHCRDNIVHLELAAGEAVLLHNWLLHSSDVNRSGQSRRAFSVCYMDAATGDRDGRPVDFPVVFGAGALRVVDNRVVGAAA